MRIPMFLGRRATREAQRGMTLMEILVVVLIMGFIMGSVAFAVNRALQRGKRDTTEIFVRRVQDAASLYYEQHNECPADVKPLKDYGIGGAGKDGWGNDVQITCSRGAVEVRSGGKDGQFGNADDVVWAGEEE